jgi:hypothetical protein
MSRVAGAFTRAKAPSWKLVAAIVSTVVGIRVWMALAAVDASEKGAAAKREATAKSLKSVASIAAPAIAWDKVWQGVRQEEERIAEEESKATRSRV